jgi:hypothetical protein
MHIATPLLVVWLLQPGHAQAATFAAGSCSAASIQTQISAAGDGDTVTIPAGTCTWGSSDAVTINKRLTVRGAGLSSTVIVTPVLDQVAFHLSANGIDLSGLTVREGRLGVYNKDYRIHHMRFDTVGITFSNGVDIRGLNMTDYPRGLIDHNEFIKKRVHVDGYPAVNLSELNNTNHWGTPLGLGTEEATYVEDNLFDFVGANFFGNAIDCELSGRYVFRYNYVKATGVETHSTIGMFRSCRKFEVYRNTFEEAGGNVYRAMFLRGGTGVVFDNTLIGPFGQAVGIDNRRSFETYNNPPGLCDGRSSWDGNRDSTGWPCRDQIGVGGDNQPMFSSGSTYPTQYLEPTYFWNNTMNGAPAQIIIEPRSGMHILEGRDIMVNRGAKPGYSPFQYPHPLASGQQISGGGSGAPAPPQNVRIVAQ